jgi:hypothetical protein
MLYLYESIIKTFYLSFTNVYNEIQYILLLIYEKDVEHVRLVLEYII